MGINKMGDLLDKIERRLGTRPLNLPDYLQKDKWADVIDKDTLTTFSRYFPNELQIYLRPEDRRTDGYFIIDNTICDSVEILGVRDIDWDVFGRDQLHLHEALGYGVYNFLSNNVGLDDIGLLQMRADHLSLFNNNIFVEYKAPNMVKISSVTGGDLSRAFNVFPVTLFIKHAKNLMTISPTMMEEFENLAIADTASFLYEELKYYDGLENVYANIDLKMAELETKAQKREDLISKLDDAHVSAANQYQPLILTV